MGKSYWTTSFYNRISSTKGNFIIFLIYCPVKVDNLFMFSNIVYVNVSTRLVLRLLHNSDITRQFWDKSLREHEGEDHTISNKYGRSRFLYYFRVEIYIIFELPRCHMIPTVWRYQRSNQKLQNTTQIVYSQPQRVKIISHSTYFLSNEIYSRQYFLWKCVDIFPDTYHCAIPYLNYFQLSMRVVTWYIFPE